MSEDDLDAIDRQFAALDERLGATNKILIGLLVALTVTSITLAVNLATGAI